MAQHRARCNLSTTATGMVWVQPLGVPNSLSRLTNGVSALILVSRGSQYGSTVLSIICDRCRFLAHSVEQF